MPTGYGPLRLRTDRGVSVRVPRPNLQMQPGHRLVVGAAGRSPFSRILGSLRRRAIAGPSSSCCFHVHTQQPPSCRPFDAESRSVPAQSVGRVQTHPPPPIDHRVRPPATADGDARLGLTNASAQQVQEASDSPSPRMTVPAHRHCDSSWTARSTITLSPLPANSQPRRWCWMPAIRALGSSCS